MKRYVIYLVWALLISTTTFPFFDLSPWIVIDNTTKFDFICEIEARYSPCEKEAFTLFFKNDDNLNIVFSEEQDENENEYMKIIINFTCYAEHPSVLNPMFYEENELFNPEIKSLKFTHQSLQLTTFCSPIKKDHRYFSIAYQPDNGIMIHAGEISTYIKCLNNFKQMMRNVVLAALDATNWLPY